jgi:formylglycine-generating enzyme required for sulfatase activity
VDTAHFRDCGNFDDDACLEWSAAAPCEQPLSCQGSGLCLSSSPCEAGYVPIAAGRFQMGSELEETWRMDDEHRHEVELDQAFCIKAHELTQGEFEALMGYAPATFRDCGADCPVENISWHESASACNALSAAQGLPLCYDCEGLGPTALCTRLEASCRGYRLPTEAEWEFAARAGTTSAFVSGPNEDAACADPILDELGWYCGNAAQSPQAVGSKRANGWGLFDTAGNVFEWVEDYYGDYPDSFVLNPTGPSEGQVKVLRGGAFQSEAWACRSANRTFVEADFRSNFIGLRPLRWTALP